METKLQEKIEKDLESVLTNILYKNHEEKSVQSLIEEKCIELGISQRQLCEALDIHRKSIQRFLEGEQEKLDVIVLIKLSNFLNIDIKDLLSSYMSSVSVDEAREMDISKRNSFILNNFDLKSLKHVGFITSIFDFDTIEERILKFFNLNTIFEYNWLDTYALFSRGKKKSNNKMLSFWLTTVNYQLKKINNNNVFDRERLLNIIPKLRISTTDEKTGFRNFLKALYECGVSVIVETYLSNTSIYGGTFVIDDKPCIVLTNYYKNYPGLWFTLAHELYHVLMDLEVIKTQSFHLSGDVTLFNDEYMEKYANDFARNLLLKEEKYTYIQNFINMPELVEQYAKKWDVHPSIIYSIYLHDNGDNNNYRKYKKYVPQSTNSLTNIEVNPWQTQKIEETILKLKESLSN